MTMYVLLYFPNDSWIAESIKAKLTECFMLGDPYLYP